MFKIISHLAHSIIRQDSTQGEIQVVRGHPEIPCVIHTSGFSFYPKKAENLQASDQVTFSFQSSFPICFSISAPHFSHSGSSFSAWGNGITVNVGSKEPGHGFSHLSFIKFSMFGCGWRLRNEQNRGECWLLWRLSSKAFHPEWQFHSTIWFSGTVCESNYWQETKHPFK